MVAIVYGSTGNSQQEHTGAAVLCAGLNTANVNGINHYCRRTDGHSQGSQPSGLSPVLGRLAVGHRGEDARSGVVGLDDDVPANNH
jgi:hypothetical protein